MSDAADIAATLADATIANALALISPDIPAGVAGVCDACGETMPRLVGGRCGFCRDGRRPPLSRFESLPVLEIPAMPNPKPSDDFRNVSILARGSLLAAIKARAEAQALSLNKAAQSLIEDGMAAITAPTDAEPISVVSLATMPAEWLTDELLRRLAARPGHDRAGPGDRRGGRHRQARWHGLLNRAR